MAIKRDKFTEDHKKYYPLIFSAVFTKVENIDDAKDICQEVFIRYYENFEKVIDSRKWLYGTLRNVVLEFYRMDKGNVDIDDVFKDISLTFVNGFRDARIIISEAMEEIANFNNEDDKILFDLVAVYNYSYTEAGRQMGLTKRQVEYKYRQIVDKIISYLEKKGIRNFEDLL
ncbi:MAG: sigma-70 family RNA polymerase sigma factor [Spirochaetes bacterium]|nr:sigma-70 family RNA polymerase sigma factor [Spirochaetota bacterium]